VAQVEILLKEGQKRRKYHTRAEVQGEDKDKEQNG
jgi:hypothetical protein